MTEDILNGLVLDEETLLTLDELSHVCQVRTQWIIELVDEGILEPSDPEPTGLRFTGSCLQRVAVVRRLQNDLGINIAGAALALDLMEEIETMKARLRLMNR